MHISWQLIEAFVHVAEAGSLTEAAQKMHLSQCGITQQRYGQAPLFDRSVLSRLTSHGNCKC